MKKFKVSQPDFALRSSMHAIHLTYSTDLIPKFPADVFVARVWPLLFENNDRLEQVEALLNYRLVSTTWTQFVDDSEEMFEHQLRLTHSMSQVQYRSAPGRFRTWSRKYEPGHSYH